MSVPAKVLAKIIEGTIKKIIDDSLEDSQFGFRKGRSTQDAFSY